MSTEKGFEYHAGQRSFQEHFDSVRLADRLVERTYQTELDAHDKKFIESQRFFFLATADDKAEPYCTFRGGAPGFVKVENSTTLIWPEYNGNGMFLALGNINVNPQIHLLFIDFERQERFRVVGNAQVLFDDLAMSQFAEAQSLVRIHITRAFPNCKRYIPKMQFIEPSRHVPQVGIQTPCADWKRSEWACDVLPVDDPANDPSVPS